MSQRYIGGLIYNPPGGFSGYFDGSGDSLTVPDSTAFTMGSGDFSVEFWYFPTSSARQLMVAQTNAAGNTVAFWVEKNSSNQLRFVVTVGGTQYVGTASETMAVNSWSFIQVVRSGTTVFGYQNGSQVCSASVGSGSLLDSTDVVEIGGVSVGLPVTGYISNVRILKGTASSPTIPTGPLQAITNTSLLTCAYPTFRDGSSNNFTITVNGNTAVSTQNPFPLTQLPNPALGNQGNGVYSMSQYQALRSQNLWPAIDPYFDYVTLMLHGNGTNGAQNNTFLDSSTNNFTITRNGNTTQGTFTPYGSNWSNYFDGSGDYLTVADNTALQMSGDFTWEAWVFPISNPSGSNYKTFWAQRATNLNIGGPAVVFDSAGNYLLFISNAAASAWSVSGFDTGLDVTLNQWQHIALVKSGTTLTLYKNGVAGTSTTHSTAVGTSGSLSIMAGAADGVQTVDGYMSNFRIVKGTAVYTSNFTPSTAPLTAITNTSLLTCADNRFIDDSSNNFTITRNGDVSVQRFSPFNPTTPYAAGTIGGSGYFDGSGDYLTAPSNAAFDFGTGDFTIEAWGYRTSSGAYGFLISRRAADANFGPFSLGLDGSNVPYFACSSSGSSWIFVLTGSALPLNTWFHLAGVRNGNTFTLYVNGVSVGTASSSASLMASSVAACIGAHANGSEPFAGYIANPRIVKGTAVYTSNFTPNTSPLTAVTNTSLLLNFTNGGIIDNAMMNDLETVGNAQISTARSKFGGASMLFNGSTDALAGPSNQNLAFGTGDFTVEGWFYQTADNTYPTAFEVGNHIAATGIVFITKYAGNASVYSGGFYGAAATTLNTWNHIAWVRSSGVLNIFVNGILGSTTAFTNNLTDASFIRVGTTGSVGGSAYYFAGNIDDLRVTKGYARYTANFTPQRSQWQDQ